MPQDAFTLNHLCFELNDTFSGGKINKIVQPSKDTVVLTVYTGKRTERLLLDVNPGSPRIGVTEENFESPLTAPNFCMLLRKHLLSATIEHISIVGFDRIVKIELSPSEEYFDSEKKVLYVELMGRYSNIILTEKGKVLGGNRGVNFFDNGVRPLIVGRDYILPPKGEKREPWDNALIEIFNNNKGEKVSFLITSLVQGFATSTADEVERKFIEKYSEKADFGRQLHETLNSFIEEEEKNPCVILSDGVYSDVCAFPYKAKKGELIFFDKLYLAEEYYFSGKQKQKKKRELFERLQSVVNTAEKKIKKRLVAICSREKESDKAEENRLFGELILANLYKIKQGEEKVVLDNYYDGGKVQITLDKNLSPSKNAENFYKKYNKQKRAKEMLLIQREQAESEANYLSSVKEEIALCETIEELFLVKDELEAEGILKEQKNIRKKGISQKFRLYEIEGFIVKVGRNNTENDEVTLSAKGSDVWVHSKDYHSAHAIIENRGREVPLFVILKVASICAYYSKARNSGKTEVVYTERKFVKKPKKSKAGFFTYTDYNTVVVSPNRCEEYLK